jgi:gliding motility associated protien GldN
MKMKNLSMGLLVATLLVSGVVNSQTTRKKTTKKDPPKTQSSGYGSSGYGTAPATQQPTQSSGYGNNNQPQQTNQPLANIPIVVVASTGNAAMDTIKPSLRNDASIERNLIKDRQPLAYEHIREDDAVYRQRVWREIDTREKMNLPFRYSANEDNGNQRFIAIILKAIRDREITAFDPMGGLDDRFTTPLTPQAVMEAFSGGVDTVPVYDLNGNIEKYEVRGREVDPDSIYQFRLKEEWVFDKESSRMFVRILGICPVKPQYSTSGVFIGMVPLFWIYYPDARGVLSRYEAFNGKNFGARMTWEELFENRMFSSYITKSTMDNPYDRRLKDYIKDPILRLLEGENIKDKIFNYEQDLWSY